MTIDPDAPVRSDLLAGRVALVTGASSGLGERFARTLAAAGASVALMARRRDRLDALVAGIHDEGGRAEAFPADMADAAALPALVAAVAERLGTIDILVNNAGIGDGGAAVDQSVEEIDRLLAINVRAPFLLAREVARRLIAEGRTGRIVNIASVAAHHYDGKVPCAMYAVAKAGVVRMTETLAVEWARDFINVNAIEPGLFRSEMSAPMLAARGDYVRQRQKRGRVGEPHQLDTTLLYLVSPASDAVTGISIKVDDAQMPR